MHPSTSGHPRRCRRPARPLLTVFLGALLTLAGPVSRAASPSGADAPVQGRRLVDVLEELRGRGVPLIYSSALVTGDLQVTVEPRADSPESRLREILLPLGLDIRPGPGGSLLVVAAGDASTGRLRGRVISADLGRPVAGARLSLPAASLGTRTRPDGTFTLAGVPAGRHALLIRADWYLDRTLDGVEVSPGDTVDLDVVLEPQPGFVEEVVVTPSTYSVVQDHPAATLTMSREDAVLVPAFGGDVTRAIESLPGVARPDNSAAFNVRGSRTRDVSLVLDGLELYDPFHLESLQSPFSFIDTDIVESVDFLRGGFTAEAGDRHGGFVRLSTREPPDDHATTLEVGSLHSRVGYGAAVRGGRLLASARAWYPEAFAGNTIELGESGLNPHFQDAYVKLTMPVSPRTIVSTHALLGRDSVDFTESDGDEHVESDNASGYLWTRVLHSWSPGVLSDTVLSIGRLERLRRGFSDPEDEALIVDDQRTVDFLGLRHDVEWTVSRRHLLKGGLDIRPLDAEYVYETGPPEDTSTTRLTPSGTSMGLHAAYRAAITERLATEIGLRWDRQNHTDDAQLSPRFNAVWRVGSRSVFRIGVGRYYQSQRIHELLVEDGETIFREAELSRQLELTFEHRFGGGLGLRLDAYDRRLTDVHPYYVNLFNPLELFPEIEEDRVTVAPDRSRFRGVELLLRSAPGRRLTWWSSYTWSTADDRADGREIPRGWDQTHAGNFLVSYRWSPRWTTSISGSVHRGWPTTPVGGELVTLPDGTTEIEPVIGPRNSDRFPTYARFDLEVVRTVERPAGRVRLALQISNLTDRENACCVDEVILTPDGSGGIDSRRRLEHWLRLTPSFSVLWQF